MKRTSTAPGPVNQHVGPMLRRVRAKHKRLTESQPLDRQQLPLAPIPALAKAQKPLPNYQRADGSAQPSGAERRVYTRKSLQIAVDLQSGSNFFVGKTRDISEGGMFLETNVCCEMGSSLVVNLWLDKQRFELACEVMWVLSSDAATPQGVGVRFVHLPQKAKAAISEFMAKRAPDLDVEPVAEPPPLPSPLPQPGTIPQAR